MRALEPFRLHRYWAATNVAEGRFWLRRLLGAAPPDARWGPYALYALGYLGYWSGDADSAVRDLRTAVSRLDGTADSYAARALIYLAGLLDDQDRVSEAVECVRSAIDAARPFGTDLQVAAVMGMGPTCVRSPPGEMECFLDVFDVAWGLARDDGQRRHTGTVVAAGSLFGAFAGGGMAGTAMSFAMELTVPGQVHVPLAGVSYVAVHPLRRRRAWGPVRRASTAGSGTGPPLLHACPGDR